MIFTKEGLQACLNTMQVIRWIDEEGTEEVGVYRLVGFTKKFLIFEPGLQIPHDQITYFNTFH